MIPAMTTNVYLTLYVSPVYLTVGSILITIAAVLLLLLPLRTLHTRNSAATPLRSVSPDTSQKPRPEHQHSADAPSKIAGILTSILSVRRGSTVALPPPSSPAGATPGRYLPNTTRTDAEIAAYGRFPDYAALSGVLLPKPYEEFDISKARARPYRPFRWAYHQTMSFKKMEPDWWLELENTYSRRIAQRIELYNRHGEDVLQCLPGAEAACTELMEMVLQFLVARYPQYFALKYPAGEDTESFVNQILGRRFRIREMHPLVVLLTNVPEDFAITIKNEETGAYEFHAGIICSSLGWNVASKIGKTLQEIHQPIPDYEEKMSKSMDRYFSKMPTNMPIQRGSWGLEYKEPLYMPPDDPHARFRNLQLPLLKLEDVRLRVDWQTLRRLPLSGAIVFNFKALFTPITEFADEPCIPALVLEILEKGKKSLMEYKSTWHVEHVVKPALREWAEEQVRNGLAPKDWEVGTLEEYPMFKGWEEKWHRAQRF